MSKSMEFSFSAYIWNKKGGTAHTVNVRFTYSLVILKFSDFKAAAKTK